MKCANCGGNIHLGKACESCGISYEDMLDSIHHNEMIEIFKRLKILIERREDISIEASLLACELLNSSLIVPAFEADGHLIFHPILDEDDKLFLPLFTDMETLSHFPAEIIPMTNSFDKILELSFEGIVINPNEEYSCSFENNFIDRFFR